MAPTTSPAGIHASDVNSIKAFAEKSGLATIPSTYHSLKGHPEMEVDAELEGSIPVIDFSLLVSDDPELHAKGVRELGNACEEWGFFMLTNHGIPEKLVDDVLTMSEKFHEMSAEDKAEFADKGPFAPIRHGTSFNPAAESLHYWRDYLKVITHPEFNFPHKPEGYKELAFEYSRKIREVLKTLLQGTSESFGLAPNAIVDATGYESGLQIFAVNLYPPCPQPDLALGMPPHSDHGLMTLLTQNGIGGLQVHHKGKWVKVDPLPKCLLVNTGDQLEAVSNGKIKSVMHRAMVNNTKTRVTLVLVNGPDLNKAIGPLPELLQNEEAKYKTLSYKDYFEIQQKTRFADKSALDEIRINP